MTVMAIEGNASGVTKNTCIYRWAWTLQELATIFPDGQMIQLTNGQLRAITQQASWQQSVWQSLYAWLCRMYHVPQDNLHNTTYVGQRLQAQFRQLEKQRWRTYHHLAGEKLERALRWSNVNSGPMEHLRGWPIRGNGLYVLPTLEDRQAQITEAWRRKLEVGRRWILRQAAGETFTAWMRSLSFLGYPHGIGDLADDIVADEDFPTTNAYEEIEQYLMVCGACDAAFACLEEAWQLWRGRVRLGQAQKAPRRIPRAERVPPLTPTQRFRILKRDNYACQLCGRTTSDSTDIRLHVDHKIARAHGGTNDETNLWVLCHECNHGKHTSHL